MTLPDAALYVQMGKDVLLAIAGLVAAVVAVKGINSWRRETQGKARYEVARSVSTQLYKLRDNIEVFREPFIGVEEFGEHDMNAKAPADRFKAYQHMYQSRWKPLFDSVIAFQGGAVDAEVLLGEPARDRARAVIRCVREIDTALGLELRDIASARTQLGDYRKTNEKKLHGDWDDDFGKKVMATIDALKVLLDPELREPTRPSQISAMWTRIHRRLHRRPATTPAISSGPTRSSSQ